MKKLLSLQIIVVIFFSASSKPKGGSYKLIREKPFVLFLSCVCIYFCTSLYFFFHLSLFHFLLFFQQPNQPSPKNAQQEAKEVQLNSKLNSFFFSGYYVHITCYCVYLLSKKMNMNTYWSENIVVFFCKECIIDDDDELSRGAH